ncbi:MAG: CDP-alcohol phosphatidyltransferase family protein [Acidimicrobiia bacterium]|nr:MAG: CDP-alcohol phosphatidyltransferase family protein [Acidimicrobiia bacterium]
MLDLKGRKKAAPILEPIAAGLAKIGVTPAVVTVIGLALTVGGAGLIASGFLVWGGLLAGIGVILDALDGPLARRLGTASDRGAFLDTMSDRFGEIAVWVGLSVYLRNEPRLLVLCIVALAFSLLVPYVRAKAEVAGLDGQGGWMGRAERMILVLIGMIAVGLGLEIMEPLLWVFVVLTGLTVAQRIRKTWQQLEA